MRPRDDKPFGIRRRGPEQRILAEQQFDNGLRLGEHRRRAAVRIERGVGLHLGAVQHQEVEPDQAGIAVYPQHGREHRRQPVNVTPPKACDNRIVWHVLAHYVSVAGVPAEHAFDRPSRIPPCSYRRG